MNIQVWIPGENEPTDLEGYDALILSAVAFDVGLQLPDYLCIDLPLVGVTMQVKDSLK